MGVLSLSARMARACSVRSSFSLGVNRISPLTQRLISRVAISVMRICSPRSVMEMAPAISIAFWHSLMDIMGGEGGMRGRSASAMMARAHSVSSSWRARRKPDISADPVLPLSSEGSGDDHLLPTNHHRDAATGAVPLALSAIPIALWQDPMDIFDFIFPPSGEPSELSYKYW